MSKCKWCRIPYTQWAQLGRLIDVHFTGLSLLKWAPINPLCCARSKQESCCILQRRWNLLRVVRHCVPCKTGPCGTFFLLYETPKCTVTVLKRTSSRHCVQLAHVGHTEFTSKCPVWPTLIISTHIQVCCPCRHWKAPFYFWANSILFFCKFYFIVSILQKSSAI